MAESQRENQEGRMEPGEDLVVIGSIGQTGTRILAEAGRKKLSQWFSESYLQEVMEYQENDVQKVFSSLPGWGVTALEPAGEGGIFKAVWDLSGRYRTGVVFRLCRIPILQGTIEICERWGCNPYRLYCGNCLVAAAYNGGQAAERCNEAGITAAVIGQVMPGIAREILHGEETGYLERPTEDELYRVLGRENAMGFLNTYRPVTGEKAKERL